MSTALHDLHWTAVRRTLITLAFDAPFTRTLLAST